MADIALITGAVVAILTALSAFIVKIHLKRIAVCCLKANCLHSRANSRVNSAAELPPLDWDPQLTQKPIKAEAPTQTTPLGSSVPQ
jgi:hypothetical protein